MTMRNNTERPITVEMGTNRIAGTARATIVAAAREALSQRGQGSRRCRPSGTARPR